MVEKAGLKEQTTTSDGASQTSPLLTTAMNTPASSLLRLAQLNFLIKRSLPWRLVSLFQLWLAGWYEGQHLSRLCACFLPALGNSLLLPRRDWLPDVLKAHHGTGTWRGKRCSSWERECWRRAEWPSAPPKRRQLLKISRRANEEQTRWRSWI